MASFSKRKRKSLEAACAFFPDDTEAAFRKARSESQDTHSAPSKIWQKCGDGFQELSTATSEGSSVKKLSTVRQLLPSKAKLKCQENQMESDFSWSSSESDGCDGEPSSALLKPQTDTMFTTRNKVIVNSYSKYLHMMSNLRRDCNYSDDEFHVIEWDNESEQGNEKFQNCDSMAEISDTDSVLESPAAQCEKHLPCDTAEVNTDAEISDYSSDGDATLISSLENNSEMTMIQRRNVSMSASDWIKSAQALLQTPKKQGEMVYKTPEDSAKKKKRFVRGGLAEQLNRLQCRERSAISFWRHQYFSNRKDCSGQPGVLSLKVLKICEECSMQIALCQLLEKLSVDNSLLQEVEFKVLFTKATASLLKVKPGDHVHIHPPWKKIIIPGETCPVIINTYFSQKVLQEERETAVPTQKLVTEKKPPPPLLLAFNLMENKGYLFSTSEYQVPSSVTGSHLKLPDSQKIGPVCDSLLEAIESYAVTGSSTFDVKAVVQRVYILHLKQSPYQKLSKHSFISKAQASSQDRFTDRLCVLVQDVYGIFSEVQLPFSYFSKGSLLYYCSKWEGKLCIFNDIKVLQRTTRARSTGLFILIDNLWPPLVPLKVHGNSPYPQDASMTSSQYLYKDNTTLSAPCFCYILSTCRVDDAVKVLKDTVSDLYLPPVIHRLREILENDFGNRVCSFSAFVMYSRLQSHYLVQNESWLFVTDSYLQSSNENKQRIPKVVAVCVTTSCVIDAELTKAVQNSAPCELLFKDAVIDNGVIMCVERTVLQKETVPSSEEIKSLELLSGPLSLDELGSTTVANSICTVKGTISGVDENSAYSWPVCDNCGNDELEQAQKDPDFLFCLSCRRVVTKPTVRMQLEIFLNCSFDSQATVKMKLQQVTIEMLLGSTSSNEQGYEVEQVLGKELGPLCCFVHTITRKPALWIGLEEINI
ncbi:DNA repair-scaffolding protein isoform X2 [Erpetoichthys calabaricus]|uniref:Scaffold protein involved in DNA repair n=1 Tax=Erpetoichthys calabaricus TaxID=27687 RepID=A0A8C4RYM0_ERPCA|nr:DNA repair-scaffolding protein isoform X2 [Erpetoichthys calabaricus]